MNIDDTRLGPPSDPQITAGAQLPKQNKKVPITSLVRRENFLGQTGVVSSNTGTHQDKVIKSRWTLHLYRNVTCKRNFQRTQLDSERYLVIALFIQTLKFIITGCSSGNGSQNAKRLLLWLALFIRLFSCWSRLIGRSHKIPQSTKKNGII